MDEGLLWKVVLLDGRTLLSDSFLPSLSFSPLLRKVVLLDEGTLVEGCPLDGETLLSDSFLLSLSFSPLLRKVVLQSYVKEGKCVSSW